MNADRLIEMIEDAGHEARSYSGRGMYGKQCVGVTTDDQFALIADLMQTCNDEDEVEELSGIIRKTQQDNMGLDVILYWPRIEWPKDREDAEDEE